MKKLQGYWLGFVLLNIFLINNSCSPLKAVEFTTKIDTEDKNINYQEKKTYISKSASVYISNEFDGARLNGVKELNDSTSIVFFSPENTPINSSPYYAFKAWANKQKTYYFKFKYPEGFEHRYIPKVKVKGRWSVIDTSRIKKENTVVTIKLVLDSDPITVAAQEVHSSKTVKKWIENIVKNKTDFIDVSSTGKTILGKNIPVLAISKGETKGKDVILLLTRQHPPEVTGYFAFQSFLETLLSESDLANRFLEKYHVLAFPIMNPDGVDLGHWRHNAAGIDLNRDWAKYNQLEIKRAVSYISKVLRKNNAKLVLGLDFHSTWYDVFYTNKKRAGTSLPNFINDWFKGLEENISEYKVNEKSSNSTKPVSKGWLLYGHNATGITYEIGDETPRERIREIGRISAEEMMNILLK